MREWNLRIGDPITLTLAADARISPTTYADDQIWELAIGGDPVALAVQTTFGLRARALRLFPRFTLGDQTVADPAEFNQPPAIHRSYPNFISVHYSPFANIDVEAEYWVPLSQGITGRLSLTNSGQLPRKITLDWVGQLTPTEGQRMAISEIRAAPVLLGKTGNLSPVVFLTGGPQAASGPYPALSLPIDLQPGSTARVTWAHAALADPEESFALARSLAARKWEAERARLDLLNGGLVEVYTGDPDWDSAFAMAQKTAYGLLVGPTPALPCPSFVMARLPDQGFSLRGDGSDYNHLWNGQTPLEAYFLSGLLLPAAPHLAQGLLHNFLAVQESNGYIDWKPGLAGQRSRLMATPLLVSLAWRIYEATEDRAFLEEAFPALLKFILAWFTVTHDRDGDGLPEWDHPMQAGMDDHPIYSRWHPWSQGVEISAAESPSLCALLYQECRLLARIARLLGRDEPVQALEALAESQRTAVEISWDPSTAGYYDWDRETHFSAPGEWLAQQQGPGLLHIGRSFDQPIRLLVRVRTAGESTRRPQIFVHGSGASGKHRVENIADERFKWYMGIGSLTGEYVYRELEHIEIRGLDPEDIVEVYSVGYRNQNQSLLLPLWAGIPDEKRAADLVKRNLTHADHFWLPHGIPACAAATEGQEAGECLSASVAWNELIGEGLVRYGFRAEAATLVTRLMDSIVAVLKRDASFRRAYHAQTGLGMGERNALSGLAPLRLFLETLGVSLISPEKVILSGFNPFPWPVTVKYRGLTILRQKEKTMVIFPDGQTTVVSDPAAKVVLLEVEARDGAVEKP